MQAVSGRRWSLAAAIASVAVFGLSIGQGAPLIALLLETHGTDATLNGLNAGTASIGIILGPFLAPRGVRALGIARFLLLCLAADVVTVLAMKPLASLADWFVLRFLLGLIGANIFTATEAWINRLADDAGRGRILGLYAATLSAGFGIGPLLLSLTGLQGWPPFLVNAGVSALAALPLLAVRDSGFTLEADHRISQTGIVRQAPVIFIAVALFGLFEMTLMTLLPVWGVRLGLDQARAATMLSVVYIGAIALQLPIGWLSDRLSRPRVLSLCGAAGLVGALALALVPVSGVGLFALLFVWGGIAAGIYPVALGMAGDRFAPAQLVGANAVLVSAYGFGSLAGPVLGGAAMDLWDPQGLPALFVLLFLVFLLVLWRGRRRATAAAEM